MIVYIVDARAMLTNGRWCSEWRRVSQRSTREGAVADAEAVEALVPFAGWLGGYRARIREEMV